MSKQTFIDTVDDIFTRAKKAGIFHLSPDDEFLNGRIITIDSKPLVNFGSCSYLALEKNEFIIDGIVQAAKQFGSQFSSSRAYVSCPLYDELEQLLQKLSGYPSLVTPSTTLGHFSSLPTLVSQNDLVILDHQVHASVQSAVRQLRATGIQTTMIEHSNLEELEQKLNQFRHHKEKIWYCLDGVYSMYGDFAPLTELVLLQQKYSQLNLYIDDAHGFSWTGEFGKGYVLSQLALNERIVVAASLNKAFAASGGVLFFANEEQKRKVRTCGGTLIFSGPIQPPMLGAAINSAKLHLNGEVGKRQKKLAILTKICSDQFKQLSLPDISNPSTPIFYIATSLLDSGFELVNKMMQKGKYVNIGLYPAVPIANTGVRFTLNTHLHEQDVRDLCLDLANAYSESLYSKGANVNQVIDAFNLNTDQSTSFKKRYQQEVKTKKLKIEIQDSIHKVDQVAWSKCFGDDSFLHVNYLDALEKTFSQNYPNQKQLEKDNTWQFYYVSIFDQNNQLILATMFTRCFMKDDMLLEKMLSEKVEAVRQQTSQAFSSYVLMMGTLITEGSHLFVDTNHAEFKHAVLQLIEWMKSHSKEVSGLILRDFIEINEQVESVFMEQGFIKTQGLDNHKLDAGMISSDIDAWQMQLKPKYRYFQRAYVLPHYQKNTVNVCENYDSQQLEHFYQLYLNVQRKAREINTYALPKALFDHLIQLENSEILEVYIDSEAKLSTKPQAMVLCLKQGADYYGVVAAIDYAFIERAVYRQMLVAIVDRARELNSNQIHLGFGASLEKKRIGAKAFNNFLYVQQFQHFSFEAMNEMSSDKH
ncbi:aminotransferase class I/II-fold pyridoxal phosphate-dependent enzyme [Marinicellulosiphila megalodicopiae]|uniref:aminotransferase class I/II-fold pyridoxal phosphate-dependent enzyme n=1 Tax=Marinicellulosiphila megalodicopiae TaxID=2724896 RepID=UPI003BB22216